MSSEITASTSLSAHRNIQIGKSKSKNRFQTLWDEAERVKQQNLELEEALDNVVHRINTEVGPLEHELAIAMRSQIDKLIVFAGRKSLTQWQVAVLDEWIGSTIDFLEPFGLIDVALKNNLAGLQAKAYGIHIDIESDQSVVDQLIAGIDEQLDELEPRDDDRISELQNDTEDFIDWFTAHQAQLDLEEGFESDEPQSDLDDGQLHTTIIDAKQPQTVLKTLFHRVARALHPDKETNPAKMKIKQALMSQLLDARRQHDLMRIVQLYQEHVEAEVDFADHEFEELEKVLTQFIERERQRTQEIATKSYLHEIAFNDFYSTDPKKINRAIVEKISQVNAYKKNIQTFSTQVTSLKKLKPYLESRFDQLHRYF